MSRRRRPSRHSQRRRGRRTRAAAAGGGLAVLATVLSGSVSEAATHPTVTVTSLKDGRAQAGRVKHGRAPTLADAIAFLDKRPQGGTITFASKLSGTIDLRQPLPVLTRPIVIRGPGESKLTVRNSVNRHPVFEVDSRGISEISGATITGGRESGILALTPLDILDVRVSGNRNSYSGGGIDAPGGVLGIARSTISGNVSTRKGGGGGGIYLGHRGELVVEDSTIRANHAPYGAGIDAFGAVYTLIRNSTVSGNIAAHNVGGVDLVGASRTHGPTGMIINSTIADNHARSVIGGIYVGDFGKGGSSKLTLISSTVSGNVAAGGHAGGIETYGANLQLLDSILAGNRDRASGSDASPDVAIRGRRPGPASAEFSLIGDGVDTIHRTLQTDGTDIVGNGASPARPDLSRLGHHGGPTETMPPRRGSPALGHGNTVLANQLFKHLHLHTDQRGRPRIGLFGSHTASDSTDIGAVEITRVLQTHTFTSGNQRFSVTTAARTHALSPAGGLPVVLHSRTLAHRSPRLRVGQVVLRISGQHQVHRYVHANARVVLPLRGLARGRHTLRATVTYSYRQHGRLRHLSRSLRLGIEIR